MSPLSILIDLIQAASVFALGAVGLALLGDRLASRPLERSLVVGGCLAGSALLSMADPVIWRPGFTLDGRYIGILLAGPVGGIPSVLVVGALCTAMRVYQGGAGLPPALVALAATSILSVGWSLYGHRRQRPLDHRMLLLIGATSLLPLLAASAALPSWMDAAECAGIVALLFVFNFIGMQIVGALIVFDRQRRDALRALKQSEERFAAIAANVPGAIYQRRLTPDGVLSFRYVSEGVQDLLGVSADELTRDATLMDTLLPPAELERRNAALALSAQTLEPFSLETVARRPDGSTVSLTSRSIPRRERSGDVVWEGIMLDVSERVALEQAARDSGRRADAANAAKTRFLAFVTHELRSPLNAILGYCDLAAMSPVFLRAGSIAGEGVSALRSYLETVHHAAEHLIGMTEDLLDLGKSEAGKLDIHPGRVDLSIAVDRVVSLLRHQSEDRSVVIEMAVDAGLTVMADPRRLQQILLNLVGNAVKYSELGGHVLVTGCSVGAADVITVEDTGIGMSPAQVKIAFEAYGQVDNRENRVVAGTGLGLPLVKQLVELHGGSLELDSALGRGTKVIVRLPRTPGAVRQAAAA